jgi:GMP synthase (glutamine-hydrolysing)
VSRRILVVQHQDTCPPALVGQWLEDAGLTLDVRRPDRGETLPLDLAEHDALLVLGGSMDADDETGYPWLADTVSLLRAAVLESLPVLGVCLGHQLLARACGGLVARNPRGRQLGLLPMGWTDAAAADAVVGALAGTGARCLQWNQDIVVQLPDDAVVLAQTPFDEPQAVRFAPLAWGIQAHPEVDETVVQWWADDAAPDVVPETAARAVAAVAAAEAELEATWRPLADAWAGVVRRERVASPW